MKKVLVIGRQHVGEKNDARILARSIGDASQSLSVEGAYYEEVVIVSRTGGSEVFIHQTDGRHALQDYDAVVLINWSHSRLYTDIAHSIAYVAEKLGIEVWNSELVTARSSTKVSQIVQLSYEAFALPVTLYSLTLSLLEAYTTLVGEPFIAKDPLASRGRSNYLFHDWETCQSSVDPSLSYLVQSFIPNDKSDLRLLIAGAEPVLAILRKGEGDTHLNNVSQGARAEVVELSELPEELLQQAAAIARHFKRELSGIDFMRNTETDEYIFLEINTTPQIVNGVFVNEKAAAIARQLER